MEKQDNKFAQIAIYIRLFVSALLLGALFVPFATGLKMTVKSGDNSVITTYKSAFSFLFSGKLVSEHVTYQAKGISVIGLIAFILVVAAFVLSVVSFFFRKNKLGTILVLVCLGLVLAGSIMMLCTHRSAATVLSDAILGEHSDAVSNTVFKNTNIEFGFWGVSLFGFIAFVGLLASLFFDGTVDKVRQLLVK